MNKKNKNIIFVVFCLGLVLFYYLQVYKINYNYRAYKIIQETQKIVRDNALPPTVSSRLYALVLSTYSDTLDAGESEKCAEHLATNMLYNLNDPEFDSFKNELINCDDKEYYKWLEWHKNDKYVFETQYTKPGFATWFSNTPPITPNAGKRKLFILKEDTSDVNRDFSKIFNVTEPPKNYEKNKWIEMAKETLVKTKDRTATETEDVLFFAGGPGTEGPAGIWLNIFHNKLKIEKIKLSEREYARQNKILAQTLADAFTVCWNVKYKYWTARPEMILPEIKKSASMASPNFPSYVSGHSTISSAAATVLSSLQIDYSEYWNSNAVRAMNSRLNGGIHFRLDNEEGFKLGQNVGESILDVLK